jgi:hypothetical protein
MLLESLRVQIVGFAVLASACGLLGESEASAAAPGGGPVFGVVVDGAEKPVDGAKVWLVCQDAFTLTPARTLAEATTDAKGRFQLPAIPWGPAEGPPPVWMALDARGRLGIAPLDTSATGPAARIQLHDAVELEGRVIDDAGKPLAKVSLAPLFQIEDPAWCGGCKLLAWPAELQKRLSAETDASGRFRLRLFSEHRQPFVIVRAGEFGEGLAPLPSGKSFTIRLRRSGTLQLAVACPEDPKAVAGLPFLIFGANWPEDTPPNASKNADATLCYLQVVRTRNDGTLLLPGLPPGGYVLQSKFPASLPYYQSNALSVEVKSGQTARAEAVLIPAAKVQGKVLDRATSKGVAGVRLALYAGGFAFRQTVTDAQGTFIIYVKPDTVQFFFCHVPEPYTKPGGMIHVDAVEDAAAPTVFLDRPMPVEAMVVDPVARPIVGAEVLVAPNDQPADVFQKSLRSDAAGKANLGTFMSNQTVLIRAHAGGAAAQKKVAVAQQQGPVRLVLSEKTATAVRGVLIDDAGMPITKAHVRLLTSFPVVPQGCGKYPGFFILPPEETRTEVVVTVQECNALGADGKFAFTGLWPDLSYRLLVNLPGHERYGSAMLRGKAGETRELGAITLARTVETLEGTVIDTAGRPLAGVRVFNAGDAPELLETRTDYAGRFRLNGFPKRQVYVFATKDGYRLAGLRTMGGATGVVLKMLGVEEPAPRRPVAATAGSLDEQKRLARHILKKAWEAAKANKNVTGRQIANILELMQTVDAQQAKRWQAESPVRASPQPEAGSDEEADTAQKKLFKVAEEDVDEAMDMLDEDPRQSVYQLQQLAGHFMCDKKDRAKALRFAEEGLVRVRSLDQPDRTVELVVWSKLLASLGNQAAAKAIREEVADTADRLKIDRRYDAAFGEAAVAIAPYDAARAIALLKKISDRHCQQQTREYVAEAIDDLKQGEALLKDADAETIKEVRWRWAFEKAPTKPAEAARVVEQLLRQKAYAKAATWLSLIVERIGTREPALARRLVDQGMAGWLAPQPPNDKQPAKNDCRPVEAAWLAALATQVGHGDMEGVVTHVLALRPTQGKSDSPLEARATTVKMAALLALADPATARWMLQTLEAVADTIENRTAWLSAWAMADPRHAAELAEKELAPIISDGAGSDALAPVLKVVEILGLPADQRPMEIYNVLKTP